jgi:hypothetical protein
VPALDTRVSCLGVLAGLQAGAPLPLTFTFGEDPQLGPPPQPPFLEGLPYTEVRCSVQGGGGHLKRLSDETGICLKAVLRICLGLLDPDPLVRGTDPDPSIIKQIL